MMSRLLVFRHHRQHFGRLVCLIDKVEDNIAVGVLSLARHFLHVIFHGLNLLSVSEVKSGRFISTAGQC
jgi:hypothetical protein